MYQTLHLTACAGKNDVVRATVLEMYFSERAAEKEKTINRINLNISVSCLIIKKSITILNNTPGTAAFDISRTCTSMLACKHRILFIWALLLLSGRQSLVCHCHTEHFNHPCSRTPAFKIADRLLLSLALHLDTRDRQGPHQVMCDEGKKSGSERKEAPIISAPKAHCCKTRTCFFHS